MDLFLAINSVGRVLITSGVNCITLKTSKIIISNTELYINLLQAST